MDTSMVIEIIMAVVDKTLVNKILMTIFRNIFRIFRKGALNNYCTCIYC